MTRNRFVLLVLFISSVYLRVNRMAQGKRIRFDDDHFKRTLFHTRHVIKFLGLLLLPLIRLAYFILSSLVVDFFFYLRKFYVQLLTILFDYATKIKKDKEIIIDAELPLVDSSFTTFNRSRRLLSREASIIEEIESDDGIESDKSLVSSIDLSSRRSRLSSDDEIQFNLDDIMIYTQQGLQAIVDDEVTKRFSSTEELAVWNLLTRTQQQHELFSVRVTLLWFIGFIVRYGFLFPYRVCLFCLAMFWALICTIFLKVVPIRDAKLRYGFYISLIFNRILARVFSAIVTFHNPEYRATRASICVANHTSPIDVTILSTDNSFSMIGQKHGGLFGFIQRCLSQTANHIWFERSESRDRHMVMQKMREHIENPDNLPLLIFPEGTCINNTSVMMFKKGSFEIREATIYPVAIKYDPRFGDAFWNSSKHQLVQYLILMMTSWAIVVDVYYLPPMKMENDEMPTDFARRVKAAIAKQGGLVDLEWDGGLKRALPKADLKSEEQRKFYQMLKTE